MDNAQRRINGQGDSGGVFNGPLHPGWHNRPNFQGCALSIHDSGRSSDYRQQDQGETMSANIVPIAPVEPNKKAVAIDVVRRLWDDKRAIELQLGATETALVTAIDLARGNGATWEQIGGAAGKDRAWIKVWRERKKK